MEDAVGHGEGHDHPQDPAQTSRRLGQNQDIGHRVEEPSPGEDPEVEQSPGQVGSGQRVQQTDQDEGHHVLQVVLVAPEGGQTVNTDFKCVWTIIILLLCMSNLEHNTCAYKRTLFTKALTKWLKAKDITI